VAHNPSEAKGVRCTYQGQYSHGFRTDPEGPAFDLQTRSTLGVAVSRFAGAQRTARQLRAVHRSKLQVGGRRQRESRAATHGGESNRAATGLSGTQPRQQRRRARDSRHSRLRSMCARKTPVDAMTDVTCTTAIISIGDCARGPQVHGNDSKPVILTTASLGRVQSDTRAAGTRDARAR